MSVAAALRGVVGDGGGLVAAAGKYLAAQPQRAIALVLRYALPAISAHREFTMAGGLFSYGTSLVDIYR